MKASETEYQSAHHNQPLDRQLQSDHKKQQHDPESCDRLNRLRVADADRRQPRQARGERGQSERPDDNAYEHEAEHRTDAQTMKQRNDDGRSAEYDERRFVQR